LLAAITAADFCTASRSISMRMSLSPSMSSSMTSRFTSPSVWNICTAGTFHCFSSVRATFAESQ